MYAIHIFAFVHVYNHHGLLFSPTLLQLYRIAFRRPALLCLFVVVYAESANYFARVQCRRSYPMVIDSPVFRFAAASQRAANRLPETRRACRPQKRLIDDQRPVRDY